MKNAKVYIAILVAVIGMLFFWHAGVHVLAREAIYPFQNAYRWVDRTVSARVQGFFLRARYAGRNAMLERDVARLRMAEQDAEQARAELEALRRMMQYPLSTRHEWVAAPVLSHGGTHAVWQTMCIGQGSRAGVTVGDVVVTPEGLAGRVVRVTPHTADVMLITDPNCRVACEIEMGDGQLGMVRGISYGGGARPTGDPLLTLLYVIEPLRLKYLDRAIEPPPRARVMTSGLGSVFPKGLVVGYLLESRLDENNLTREATVMPAVDVASLKDVFVLLAHPAKGASARAP